MKRTNLVLDEQLLEEAVRVAGVKTLDKDKGEAEHEFPPVDVRSLMP